MTGKSPATRPPNLSPNAFSELTTMAMAASVALSWKHSSPRLAKIAALGQRATVGAVAVLGMQVIRKVIARKVEMVEQVAVAVPKEAPNMVRESVTLTVAGRITEARFLVRRMVDRGEVPRREMVGVESPGGGSSGLVEETSAGDLVVHRRSLDEVRQPVRLRL
jgi:hypothetical protein